ncbi:hypothetical protein ACE6H2_010134 [Prunus campanulata]
MWVICWVILHVNSTRPQGLGVFLGLSNFYFTVYDFYENWISFFTSHCMDSHASVKFWIVVI